MRALNTAATLLMAVAMSAQSTGDVLTWKKGANLADLKTYTTPVNSSLFSLNSSGNFALLAQSNFITTANFNGLGDARWQLLDADLTSIAALSTTSYGRGFLTLADAAAARTYIGAGSSSFDGAFSSLSGKPTTIGGYGITDFNSLGDARWDPLTHGRAQHDGIPLNFHEFGVYDVLEGRAERATGADVMDWIRDDGDVRWSALGHTHTFSSLTSKPTTISGYGITDFNSLGDARWSSLGHTHAASDITSGVFNHARLGTGGGGSTKFLREDGTWQTVSSGGGTWGSITGTLSAQTDLQTELDNINSGLSVLFGDYISESTSSQLSNLPSGTKATPSTSDYGVLDDMAASGVKKGFTLGSLPISTATQTALDLKAPIASPTFTGTVGGITKSMVGLGSVENTALSTWAGSTNITTLGTLSTGQWNAARILPTYGGTGLDSYTLGDILYSDNTDNLARLPGNTTSTRQFLSQTGTGTLSAAPGWRAISSSDITGLGSLATQSGTFSGTSSGTNTGDQTITLTGDVTGSGTGSFAATIATGVIVNADINASAAIALSKLATDPLARANHTGTQAVSTISDATTVGQNLVKLTNPSAITYPRMNADNTVTARTMAQSRTDLALHPVTITAITGGSQATTSTSLANVTGSTITFPDTGWYEWEYFIIHSSGATSTGAFFAVNTGGTMVNNYITYCISYDVLSTDKDTYCVDGYNNVIASTSSRATANNRSRMQGTIHVTTAGGMVLRFATEVNASAITITELSGWYRNL